MEKYSVLMSLYYQEKPEYLRSAIDSMLNQTIKPDEIIVVEDGVLTEELYAVLDKYPELHRVKSKMNIGLGAALNLGLKECRNELVARMDTDDISKAERCEKQLKRFEERPELVIVGAWVDEFSDTIENIISTRAVPIAGDEIYKFGKKRSAFNHPVVMYRKSKVLENGGYSNLRRNQDVDLFGRLIYSGCKAENIGESLLFFRISNDLAKRRRSWENTKSYIGTIWKFHKMGYASFFDYMMVAVAQIGMFLLPIKLQHWIYKTLLRK